MTEYKGACLCGLCRYTVSGEPLAMYFCHCSRCRKETGSIHGSNLFFKNAQLTWQSGEDSVSHFKLENTRKERSFCKTCGCPLPWGTDMIVVPAGSLEGDVELKPTAHVHYTSRATWEDQLADLFRFAELPK